MKSIVLNEPGKFARIASSKPGNPSAHEALVRIHQVGICGTDYHAYRGRQPFFSYPRILGHELGVEVVAVGESVKHLKVGDKCAVEPYLNCGQCAACAQGKTNCCEKLQVMGVHTDGGMTEYLLIPGDKLHTSATLGYKELALVETLGIGCHAVNRAAVSAEQKVLVIGAGPIGLSVLEFAGIIGAETTVLDVNQDRLDFCKKHKKARHCIHPENLADNTPLWDVVFDATGNPESMKKAFKLVAHGGKLVFVGLFQGEYAFPDPEFHRKEMTIMGSRNSLSADFRYIISQMEAGRIDVQSWISKELALDDLIAQFDHLLADPTLVKAVINMTE